MKIKYGTIVVKDMEESVRFYTEVMGFKIESRHNPRPGIAITILKGEGETKIELIKNACDEPGFYSLGMDVENLDASLKTLKAKGAKVTMEPVPISVGFLAFIEDPNGTRIALIQHG
jgi:lactoylglutathione lyase